MSEADLKRAAAERAVEEVRDGMLLGLGTGTTARHYVALLGERVRLGLQVTAVATSRDTAEQASSLGIELLEESGRPIDLTVDGADEIDPHLNLVKGLGGALLREKVVAAASRRMVVIATEDKLVPRLSGRVLPVEVMTLLADRTADQLRGLGLTPALRMAEKRAFMSDNGNLIFDCAFPAGADLDGLAAAIDHLPGVMGHGLFLGLATEAILAGPDGVRVLTPA